MSNRTLALDIGTKRTGVALSDETGLFAFPLVKIEARGRRQWVNAVVDLVEVHDAGKVVVGLPLTTEGEVGEAAKNVQEHIALLQEQLNVPVIEWDERFTTAQAERTLLSANVSRKKRKGVVDKLAATILLQSYLDNAG